MEPLKNSFLKFTKPNNTLLTATLHHETTHKIIKAIIMAWKFIKFEHKLGCFWKELSKDFEELQDG